MKVNRISKNIQPYIQQIHVGCIFALVQLYKNHGKIYFQPPQ